MGPLLAGNKHIQLLGLQRPSGGERLWVRPLGRGAGPTSLQNAATTAHEP